MTLHGPSVSYDALGPSIVTYRMFQTQTKALSAHAVLAALLLLAMSAPSAVARVADDDLVGGVAVPALASRNLAPDADMAAGVVAAGDGRVLWARDAGAQRAMASTTKIMTAIVVLENADLDEVAKVSKAAAKTSESTAEVVAGKRYTVRTLLEALLVKSGNDAAVALAEHVGGSEADFVTMMNRKAQELGLDNTHFANPHGLDESSHYTCAEDLATMARYAMQIEEFKRIVALESTKIRPANGGAGPTLENSNEMIGSFAGATGVKTGWTNDAGYCLVATAERAGVELVAVVLGAKSESARFREAGRLLEWGFEHYRMKELVATGADVGEVRVADYLDVTVRAAAASTVTVPVFDADGDVETRLALLSEVDAPVATGDRVGTLTFVQGNRLVGQVPVVATSEVDAPGVLERAWIWILRGWRGLTGDIALGGS